MSRGRNSVVIGVRVPDSVYTRVKELAELSGCSVNDWMKASVMRAASLLPDGSVRSHQKKVVNTKDS